MPAAERSAKKGSRISRFPFGADSKSGPPEMTRYPHGRPDGGARMANGFGVGGLVGHEQHWLDRRRRGEEELEEGEREEEVDGERGMAVAVFVGTGRGNGHALCSRARRCGQSSPE